MRKASLLFPLLLSVCATALGASRAETQEIVSHYVAATQAQAERIGNASMEVEIAASLPRLQKRGKLYALRHISRLGRITYEALRFEGDGTIKQDVIARYLTAEVQAQSLQPSLAVTPANYRFRLRARLDDGSRETYILEVSPRKKRPGLFHGQLWVDSISYLPLREVGRMVKTPSVFLKRVEFVRQYEIRDGVAFLRSLRSKVDTRLVGPAELTVEYSNYSLESDSVASSTGAGGQ